MIDVSFSKPTGLTLRMAKTRKEKILDVAEKLLAQRGFYGVSLRDIAGGAKVDVALINYHFGKKSKLFDAVVMRRAEVANFDRARSLKECQARAAPGYPNVDEIIVALIHPLLKLLTEGGEGWHNYLVLIAQINNNPEWGGDMMNRFFDPLVHKYLDALKLALPDCDEADLHWCYQFMSGALTLTLADTGRIDNLSKGVCRSSDFESAYTRLIPFFSAGFRAMSKK